MVKTVSFKRLILRAVLRQVSPMVIRLVSVSDHMPLPEFHDVFRTILGWNGDLGYIIRVHGQEINSFRRKTRSKALHEFKLHRQEKFLYVCSDLSRCDRRRGTDFVPLAVVSGPDYEYSIQAVERLRLGLDGNRQLIPVPRHVANHCALGRQREKVEDGAIRRACDGEVDTLPGAAETYPQRRRQRFR